jgi:hypothetical protein
LVHDGAGNNANINQSFGAGNNDLGTTGAPVKQSGDRNYLGYTNSGYAHGADNDIVKLEQSGNDNWFQAVDNLGAVGNRINDVQQNGDTNQAVVTRRGDDNSIVDSLLMQGSRNVVYIFQGTDAANGHSNEVRSVSIKGNDNGQPNTTVQYRGASTNNGAVHLVQAGVGNLIASASIEGNKNGSWPNPHALTIRQSGNNNGHLHSTAIMQGSNGNSIGVTQAGNSNNFDVRQGVAVGSTQNHAKVTQTGDSNLTTATQYGSFNTLDAQQNGDRNTISALVAGDGNGSGLFGDAGARNLADANSLSSGDIFQDGLDHNVSLTITSSNNQFAFQQTGGDGNRITGTITGAGSNQAVGVQNGSLNVATLTQAGGNNVAVFQQVGSGNTGSFGQ